MRQALLVFWLAIVLGVVIAVVVGLGLLNSGDGDDGGGTPTKSGPATPTPPPEPSLQAEDDESQIRYTIEQFVYFIDQERFDDLCTTYTRSVLETVDCETIKQAITGGNENAGGGGEITARVPEFSSVTVDGDTGVVTYLFCIDIGAGESCTPNTVAMVREDGVWKING